MPGSKGRKLHAKSLEFRERKKFLESLQLDYEALREYANDKDSLSFAELLTMHAKTLIHEYNYTGFRPYLLLAKHVAMAAVDVSEESNNVSETVLPYFTLGEVSSEAGDLDLAVDSYRKAVDRLQSNPPERHDRKSVLANFKIHLTTSEYENGDKSALGRAEKAIEDLENSDDASEFELHVWLSGAHMRMAKMLKEDDPRKAKTHLMKAKEIIDSDSALEIRKDQWEKLAKDF